MSDIDDAGSLPTDIRFSDEQAMLLDSAVAFCKERSPSLTVRSLLSAL